MHLGGDMLNKKKILLAVIFVISISFLYSGESLSVSSAEKITTICKGVFIDAVDVSGMTGAEAETAVDNYIKELRGKGIAILVGENVVYRTMGELGYTFEANDYLEQAIGLCRSGNLVKRYKDKKDIEQGNIVYPLTYTFDENILKDLITKEVSTYNVSPVNATLIRDKGKFIYKDHMIGSKVDINQTFELVKNQIIKWNRRDIIAEAVMVEDLPVYNLEDAMKCDTILGEFTTEYKDSSDNRAANLANGAKFINNTVLYPGEVFSSYECLEPFSLENGYFIGGAYLDGEVIESIGGGSCQVTTTLYNAVLYSELEIVERQAHSMTVSYVTLSRDAAISEGSKDFRFSNNTDAPILVQAFTNNRKITFRIWGHETRDTVNRRIEYESVKLTEITPSADVITLDPNQPTSYKKVTQKAHIGYKAELYKIIYKNDVEVSRSLFNRSTYNAEPNHITIGTKILDINEKPEIVEIP